MARARRNSNSVSLEPVAGNGYRGVGLADCVHSGETAAEVVFTRLAPSSC